LQRLLPRQQTLQATVDWSYGLLRLPEQTLFARLSVFAGGFTLEGAEAVGAGEGVAADEVLDLLLGLVDKSLVVAEEGSTRYRLLETLRQYGREKLTSGGDATVVQARHATYYLGLAEEAERQLRGPAQIAWFDRLETEHANLLAAAQWFAQSAQVEQAVRLAEALVAFWEGRGRRNQGRALLTELLALPSAAARTAARAHALWAAGVLTLFGAHRAAARAPLEESLAIARELDDSRGIGYALWGLAWQVGWPYATVAVTEGRLEEMRDLLEESLEMLRAAGDRWASAWVLYTLGDVAWAEGDALAARALCDESRRTFLELGDRAGLTNSLRWLARVCRAQGDVTGARALLEESLTLARALGHRPNTWWALRQLGDMAAESGEYVLARSLYAEALQIVRAMGDQAASATTLLYLAGLAAAEGHAARAVRLAGAAAALREHIGPGVDVRESAGQEPLVEAARHTLSVEAAAAWAEGRTMTLEQASAYAVEQPAGSG
jgi:tetratricopeptide (TPR) repeat protein